MRFLHLRFLSRASLVHPPCFNAAAREFALPAFVVGPVDLPPCMRQVFLPRIAHLRQRFPDRLLFPVHWLTMIHGVQLNFFSYHPPCLIWMRGSARRLLAPHYVREVLGRSAANLIEISSKLAWFGWRC